MLLDGARNLETFADRIFAMVYLRREGNKALEELRGLINPDDPVRTAHMSDWEHVTLYHRWSRVQRRWDICDEAIETLRAHNIFEEYLSKRD